MAALCAVPICAAPVPARAGDPDAAELVARMSAAMRTLDYEGTFVHAARGHLSSMHILHSSSPGESSNACVRSMARRARWCATTRW